MRSVRLLAALASTLALGTACGGGGSDAVDPNSPPVANFTTQGCTIGVACAFTDASTDDHGITAYAWDFGDPGSSNTATDQNPTHTYATAGTYQVQLTVTDGSGETASTTLPVEVAGEGPTAGFTQECIAEVCTFTNTSTAAGTFTSSWDFGEPSSGTANTSTVSSPTHTYTVSAPTPFTVTLTVTDENGASATASQTITVSPAASLACDNSSETTADCTLSLGRKAVVTVTLTSSSCGFVNDALAVTSPIQQTLFTNGCAEPVGTVYTFDGPNADASFDAATTLTAQFTQGSGDPEDPKGPPDIQVTGSFPDWTVAIDDGGNLGGVGEPDFQDLVLTLHAEIVP